VTFRHVLTTIAVCAGASGLFPASSQGASRRVVIAFAQHVTIDQLARELPGASVGLLSATQGRYRRLQALVDMSQGSRTSLNAYDPDEPPRGLRVRRGRIAGWDALVRRADSAPAEVVPGLLGASVPGGAAYVGPPRAEAIVAADRTGRFATSAGRALVVTLVPGIRELRRLAARRDRDTLLIALRSPPAGLLPAQLLPTAVVGLAAGRELTSRTTRTGGLVAGTDVAPTALRWLGRPIPRGMQGQPVRADGALDLAALRSLEARGRVVPARRLPTLAFLGAEWLLVLLVAGRRRGLRVGALAVLWFLPVLLAFAALEPSRLVEEAGVGAAALGLAALTGALVPWPRAPLVPAAVGLAAYAIDLAAGSPLIVRSLFGPNPLFGARFYGVGNELESTLPVLMLAGVAAALGPGGRSRGAALAFAAGGTFLAIVLGSGRLGADVGGVITVGAGTAVAVALAAPGRLTRRRVAAVLLAPAGAVLVLAALDLATGGDAHFTRTVLRADDRTALGDVIARRYELAFNVLKRPAMLVLTPLALAVIGFALRRRTALLQGIPGGERWGAALAGAAAAGVAGALFNDSGPLLLVFSTFVAGWVLVYLRAGVGVGP
jgi:hypothetical protein